MKVFSATDIGQKRQMNQDYIFTSETPVGNLPNLFVVADGMGGHNAGDFASRYGVSVLVETARQNTNFNPVRILRSGMEAANREVLKQSRIDSAMAGMGTTMVACSIAGDCAYIGNVGDSRLYLADEESMTQITQDHSLIAEMVRMGELTPEQGRHHPDKNIITRAVGTSDEVRIDFFDIKVQPGQKILMCSDGLYNMVSDSAIHEILKGNDEGNVAQTLVDAANEGGGRDNIGVIVIEV